MVNQLCALNPTTTRDAHHARHHLSARQVTTPIRLGVVGAHTAFVVFFP